MIRTSMERVVFDGVEYIKAAAAAKQFRYTSDYIGQLCRGKKIDARLVGRTWFVNPESIVSHKKTKYKTAENNKSQDKTSFEDKLSKGISTEQNPSSGTAVKKIAVPAVTSSKAQKGVPDSVSIPVVKERTVKVSYEPDAESLLPKIKKNKNPFSKKIVINPADAKRLKINKSKINTNSNFKPSKLPEVSLSGKLSISTYETHSVLEKKEPSDNNNNYKNKDISDKRDDNLQTEKQPKNNSLAKKDKSKEPKKLHNTSVPVAMKRVVTPDFSKTSPKKVAPKLKINPLSTVKVKVESTPMTVAVKKSMISNAKPNFSKARPVVAPKQQANLPTLPKTTENTTAAPSIRTMDVSKLASELKTLSKQKATLQQESVSRRPKLLLPATATLLAILCVGLILSASISIDSSGSSSSSKILFQMANLKEVFHP